LKPRNPTQGNLMRSSCMTGPAKPQINFLPICLQNVNSKIPITSLPKRWGVSSSRSWFRLRVARSMSSKENCSSLSEIFCDAETKDVHRITGSLLPISLHQTLNETGAGNDNLLSRVDFPTPKGTNYLC
jgi:hypothetical protein